MLRALFAFVEELRAIGIPVSMVEALDAAHALEHTELGDREAVRASLAATLVKSGRHVGAFDVAFDVFFGLRSADPSQEEPMTRWADAAAEGVGPTDDEHLYAAILDALAANDVPGLRALARRAVEAYSGFEPGRRVGTRYYVYRVMRRLGSDALIEDMMAGEPVPDDPFAQRLSRDEAQRRLQLLNDAVRREILQKLVADRGPQPVAQTLRAPLVEDVDLLHATREELARIEKVIGPIARKLATRLAHRRRRGLRGRLDARKTIRRSLSHGGALIDPQFRSPRRSKPDLVLLCDVSGSMAAFSRFTLQLTHAIAGQFSRVRVFAFIDGLAEITDHFAPGVEFHDVVVDVAATPGLVHNDGHSDYGKAFETFWRSHRDALTPRAVVLVTGDARTNYREPRADLLAEMVRRSRAVYWLNPEATRYWDTGDSVMSRYALVADSVSEVRTLRQLERFVEDVALPTHRIRVQA